MAPKDFSSITSRLSKELERRSQPGSAVDPHHNLRTVSEQVDAISRGDFDAVLAQASPEATLDIFAPPEFPWVRRAAGLDGLRRALVQNFGSVEDQQPEITNVCVEGDTVVLFGRERGRLRASGQPYALEFVQKFRFRDRRLVAVHIIAAHAADTPDAR